jgi:hypothetical protein
MIPMEHPLTTSQEIGQVKGLAAERHQLTSLLSTAYTQRDALEERLQANKKSMRVARTKYGACLFSVFSVIRLFQSMAYRGG